MLLSREKKGVEEIKDVFEGVGRWVGAQCFACVAVNVAGLTIENSSILIVIIGVLIIVRSGSPVHG